MVIYVGVWNQFGIGKTAHKLLKSGAKLQLEEVVWWLEDQKVEGQVWHVEEVGGNVGMKVW